MVSAATIATGCRNEQAPTASVAATNPTLVGAWRSKVVFSTGALAGMKDLEFLHSYNAGGTMTESSNYDEAANSSPPAYGIWKQIDAHTFQTKYVFYTTKEPAAGDPAPKGDWYPAGHGVITETITVAENGETYASAIKLAIYDKSGAPTTGGGDGSTAATRIVF
jgi:hypothetical protein